MGDDRSSERRMSSIANRRNSLISSFNFNNESERDIAEMARA